MSRLQYPINSPASPIKKKDMLNISGYSQSRATSSKTRRLTILISNIIRLNWYISIVKEDYLVARDGMIIINLSSDVSTPLPRSSLIFLLPCSFKALIISATAAAYTPSVAAAPEQRDSRLPPLPPSPPYPPVLGRSNHKIRKQGSRCSHYPWCHIGGATCSGWSFGLSIEIGRVRGRTSPNT